jgi:hypothetical protein
LSKKARRKLRQRELADIDPTGDVVPAEVEGIRYAQYRQRLLKRNPVCIYCGVKVTEQTATLDHAIPRAQGGLSVPWNLWLACKPCNEFKGGRSALEWLGLLWDACVTMGFLPDPEDDDDDWDDGGATTG